MRKHLVAGSVVAVMAAVALLWWRHEPARRRDTIGFDSGRIGDHGLRQAATVPARAEESASGTAADRAHSAQRKALIAEAEAAEARVDIPMQFWGKVVDQADIAVAGAEVSYEVTGYLVGQPGEMFYHHGTTRSDREGRFSVGPVRGHELTIENLVKPGYRLLGRLDGTFTYAQADTQAGPLFAPKPDAPVTYRMAKLQGGAALVPFGFRGSVPVDGKPVLTSTGNGMLDGQFELRFTGTPPSSGKPYDWTATVSLTGGSLRAAADDYLYTAPSDGYTRTLQITMKKANPGWRHGATVSLFARTHTGRYGRFVVNIAAPRYPYQSVARIDMDGAINPNGARNLEPDAHSPP